MQRQRPRTVSVSLADRGQTTQDFAVGIGVFLLALGFTVTFVPSLLAPYDAVGSGDAAQADRVAATILDSVSTGETPNEIDPDAFNGTYKDSDSEALAADLGLRSTEGGNAIDRVNVTVTSLNESNSEFTGLHGGDDHDDQDGTVSASRIVTVEGKECSPACRLTVRLW